MAVRRYHGEPDEVREEYFFWLCDYIGAKGNEVIGREKPYMYLMEYLHNRYFDEKTAKLVDNDYNRILDGKRLRMVFKEESMFVEEDYDCLDIPCSVLELLIALAIKLDGILDWDTSGDDTASYFWELIRNLGLDVADDDVFHIPTKIVYVEEIVDQFLDRKYGFDGKGGLFPLKDVQKDQRDVEIWYQMAAYIQENYPI